MSSPMVTIEINGKAMQARSGAMLIEVADELGIEIPRFCYHKKLSVVASCRMCLVEVEKVAKPLPACATPINAGMKIWTQSPKAIAAQRNVMEFLLINHPLDCPICDQGGECDLQDISMGYGRDVSHFSEGKRAVASPDIGPLIATDMTRCIHCTRCVRFGEEIAGLMELGAPGRGEHMYISTYVEKSLVSEVSGNVIDLCPVGALTNKPYRYTARPWELMAQGSVSPHDCIGANLWVDVRGRQVMRVRPREHEAINETWLADRDRYSYLGLQHDERLLTPQVKKDGKWQSVDWDTALTTAAEGLCEIVSQYGAEQLGALAGYGCTTEEFYLLQKLLRGLGSNNIDHRLRQLDFAGQENLPAFPWLGQSLADLEELDAALLIGSYVRKEQPLLALRLRKAALRGAQLMAINTRDYDFNFPLAERRIAPPSQIAKELAAIAKALVEQGATAPAGFAELVAGAVVEEGHHSIARRLREAGNATVLIGNSVAYHAQQSMLQQLAALIAELSAARLGFISEGGNTAGAWLAGAVPHRRAGGQTGAAGLDARSMLDVGLRGYVVCNSEPELDALYGVPAEAALRQAECTVMLTPYVTETMRSYADVLLPIALWPETSGTLVNTEGHWQEFTACTRAPAEARPAWKALRVLGNLCNLDGFEYESSADVCAELAVLCADIKIDNKLPSQAFSLTIKTPALERIVDFPIYTVDAMVRRSTALQQTPDATSGAACLNAVTAARHGVDAAVKVEVVQDVGRCVLPLVLDETVPDGCVYIPAGLTTTAVLGAVSAPIELKAAE
ncbi:MAG: NADH-quinone oxidoreductase subunit NuoG [Thiohalomonadaceae bacterium]